MKSAVTLPCRYALRGVAATDPSPHPRSRRNFSASSVRQVVWVPAYAVIADPTRTTTATYARQLRGSSHHAQFLAFKLASIVRVMDEASMCHRSGWDATVSCLVCSPPYLTSSV